jgi:hypothetical protein
MAQLDLQSMVAMYEYDYLLVGIGETVYSQPHPLADGHRGVVVGFNVGAGTVNQGELVYNFQVSDDDITWRDVPPEAILPIWNQQYDNSLYAPTADYFYQTAGFIASASKSWRVEVTSALSFSTFVGLHPISFTDGEPFTGWYPGVIPT